MTLTILDSGSRANGYVLHNAEEAIVLECGCTYERCLKAVDYKRRKIVGAFVTHEHGDHSRYIEQYLKAAIPTYTSAGTSANLTFKGPIKPKTIETFNEVKVGGFTVMAFDTQHDCEEPIGFLVHHEEMGVLLFATDTYYLKYRFEDLNHIMIECNYDRKIIDDNVDSGIIKPFVRDRVMRSHMSLETTISTLKANDLTCVNNIVLLHLSGNNSDSDLFKHTVEESIGKIVTIARKDVSLSLNKTF